MQFGKRILSDRTRARSRSTAHRTNRLLVETLERRGMLSATIGSLADQAIEDVTPAEEYVAPAETLSDAGDFSAGLPEGVSLMICPTMNWAETDCGLIASTSFDSGVDAVSLPDPSSGEFGGEALFMCTGYPEPRFTLSETTDAADLVEPETTDLSPDIWQRGVVDPVVIIDPVVVDPVAIDPVRIEPTDMRIAFVTNDASWASYYYFVGADGVVENVYVVASYDEPTVAAFIAEHGNDPGVEVVDCGTCVGVRGFPLELAPAVPDKSEFWGWSESDSVFDDTTMDDGDEYSPEYQYDAWAYSTTTFSVDESADESGGVTNDMSFAAFDGQAVQRGFTPQDADPGVLRFVTSVSNSRPTGELAAAAMWMNLSGGDTGSMQLPGGKRRSR